MTAGLSECTVNKRLSAAWQTKMDSLKSVASKVKHSPQVIRKTFSSQQKSYSKVTEGERPKGKIVSCLSLARHFSVAEEMNIASIHFNRKKKKTFAHERVNLHLN